VKYIRDNKRLQYVGQRIKKLRQSQNITQNQLAFEAGISTNQLGRIERGELNTGVSTLFAIADALNMEINELFIFEDL
jgi:transcriptional regulator with XRE-family HTH domain